MAIPEKCKPNSYFIYADPLTLNHPLLTEAADVRDFRLRKF